MCAAIEWILFGGFSVKSISLIKNSVIFAQISCHIRIPAKSNNWGEGGFYMSNFVIAITNLTLHSISTLRRTLVWFSRNPIPGNSYCDL